MKYKHDEPQRQTFHDVIKHTCGQCGGSGKELTFCRACIGYGYNEENGFVCIECDNRKEVFVKCDMCDGAGYHEHDKE